MPLVFTIFLCSIAIVTLSTEKAFSLRSEIPSGNDWSIMAALIVSFAFIFIIYRLKFASWVDEDQKPLGFPLRPTRHFTTWLQYQIWASVYALIGVAIVFITYKQPSVVGLLTGLPLPQDIKDSLNTIVAETMIESGTETAIALGVSFALAMMGIPYVEPYIRQALQRAALIPVRATSLKQALIRDFSRFAPDSSVTEDFINNFNVQDDGARLYQNDFDPSLRDERYLEIYPRIEFILWQINQFEPSERIRFGLDQFEDDLGRISAEALEVRRSIKGFGQTLERLYNERFRAQIEALHEQTGFNRGPGDENSVVLYDNILREIGIWSDRPTEEEKIITSYLAQSLRELRIKCDGILDKLMQIIVLMSLRSRFDPPHRLLGKVGFGAATSARYELGWDRLLWLTITMVLTSVGVAAVLSFFLGPGDDVAVATKTFVFFLSGVLGGHFMAHLIIYDNVDLSSDERNGLGSLRQLAMCFLSSAALVILGFAILSLAGEDYKGSNVMYYSPVAAVLGSYVAVITFRTHRFRSRLVASDLVLMPLLSGLFGLIGRLLTSEGGFRAAFEEPDFLTTLMIIIVSGALGLALVLSMLIFDRFYLVEMPVRTRHAVAI